MPGMFDFDDIACFGVAGNFTGHLEQAGELKNFEGVKTASENAPKCLFPTFIKRKDKDCGNDFADARVLPEFLSVFPFNEEKIIIPADFDKLQIEPECAVIFKAEYSDGKVSALSPLCFGASNDCSIRRDGACKISFKKNWGCCSKGFNFSKAIALSGFEKGGLLDSYRICSFLLRNGDFFEYGEDSAVRDYNYNYDLLTDWLIDRFNNQADSGPAENLSVYLKEAGCPENLLVSIGATRYTPFGEKNFLQIDDVSVVILYPEDKYSSEEIKKALIQKYSGNNGTILENGDVSYLMQKISID